MVEPAGGPGDGMTAVDALLLVEVLSPSTAATDFGDKVREYLALPTLGTYLICAQDARRVWVWTRGESGWPEQPEVIEDPAASIRIPALDLSLTLEAIYRHVDL
jgi:Uma2 family endonuclease